MRIRGENSKRTFYSFGNRTTLIDMLLGLYLTRTNVQVSPCPAASPDLSHGYNVLDEMEQCMRRLPNHSTPWLELRRIFPHILKVIPNISSTFSGLSVAKSSSLHLLTSLATDILPLKPLLCFWQDHSLYRLSRVTFRYCTSHVI